MKLRIRSLGWVFLALSAIVSGCAHNRSQAFLPADHSASGVARVAAGTSQASYCTSYGNEQPSMRVRHVQPVGVNGGPIEYVTCYVDVNSSASIPLRLAIDEGDGTPGDSCGQATWVGPTPGPVIAYTFNPSVTGNSNSCQRLDALTLTVARNSSPSPSP